MYYVGRCGQVAALKSRYLRAINVATTSKMVMKQVQIVEGHVRPVTQFQITKPAKPGGTVRPWSAPHICVCLRHVMTGYKMEMKQGLIVAIPATLVKPRRWVQPATLVETAPHLSAFKTSAQRRVVQTL